MPPSRASKTTAIYLVGPSSSGKTTLCNAVANRLGLGHPVYITEVARKVMKETGFSRRDVGLLDMQKAILAAQLSAEQQALEAINGSTSVSTVLLSDRSAIDPIVYASIHHHHHTEVTGNSNEFWTTLARYRSPNSIVILLTPIPEWVHDDGIRSIAMAGNNSESSSNTYRRVLDGFGIPFHELGTSCRNLEERVAWVLRLAGL